MRLLLVDVTKLVCPLSLSSSGNALRISRWSGMVIFSIFRCHELCSRLSPPLFFVAGYRSTGSRTDRKANPQPRAPVWLRGSGLLSCPKETGSGGVLCTLFPNSLLTLHRIRLQAKPEIPAATLITASYAISLLGCQ